MVLGYSMVGEFCDGSKFGNIHWFTTFDVYRPPFLELINTYDGSYREFDNYDAVYVNRTEDIPVDYSGVMGVPITFLEKYNPEQFEIVGLFTDKRCDGKIFINGEPRYIDEGHKNFMGPVIDGKAKFDRILIKKK